MTLPAPAPVTAPAGVALADGTWPSTTQTREPEDIAEHDHIYLDYAATTPLDPTVVREMMDFLETSDSFGNPASTHTYGQAAADVIERARIKVASLLAARPDEIVWTSGATEAINLGLKGAAFARRQQGNHIVTSAMEHKAVLDSVAWLAAQGFEISYVEPDDSGAITAACLAEVMRPDTILVSLTHLNNETGTITDIQALAPVFDNHTALLHVDAVQSVARLSTDDISIADLISISAHKMYGPKGVGALRVRHSLLNELVPQTHGGGHELGLRSGTLATHQILGMGCAAATVQQRRQLDLEHTRALDHRLRLHLDRIDEVAVNGHIRHRAAGILNVAFADVAADSLLLALDHIAISTGSACTSRVIRPSHVLTALGYQESRALSSIRISFGRFTTLSDIDHLGHSLQATIPSLRQLAQ